MFNPPAHYIILCYYISNNTLEVGVKPSVHTHRIPKKSLSPRAAIQKSRRDWAFLCSKQTGRLSITTSFSPLASTGSLWRWRWIHHQPPLFLL